MLGYRVPRPDQAMMISGGRYGMNGAPFKVVTGHGAFVLPFVRKANFLTLAMREAEVAETCVTKQGIALTVRAVIAFKVGNDMESIVNAGQRFLSDQDQMSLLTGRIFAGHLRSIIGSMTVEEIVTERQAQIAQAQATQQSVMAQQEAERNKAEYARQTAIVQAQYKAEVDRAQAQAAQAGPLSQAEAQREVITAQTELAQREAELRQQQLVAEIVRPAEAEPQRVRILAQAEAGR